MPCNSSVVAVTITRTTLMKSNDLLFDTVVDAVTLRVPSGFTRNIDSDVVKMILQIGLKQSKNSDLS